MRTEEIPAGKYAGKHRGALNTSYSKPGGGAWQSPNVVCGTCEKQYRAARAECPRCGGDDE